MTERGRGYSDTPISARAHVHAGDNKLKMIVREGHACVILHRDAGAGKVPDLAQVSSTCTCSMHTCSKASAN